MYTNKRERWPIQGQGHLVKHAHVKIYYINHVGGSMHIYEAYSHNALLLGLLYSMFGFCLECLTTNYA